MPSLDDVLDLARRIPAAARGGVDVRPLVEWFDRGSDSDGDSSTRYLALIMGPETASSIPGTPEWEQGASEHARFAEQAGAALRAGGALHPVATATTVHVREGEALVSDGPFAESTEVVGGLYLLEAPTVDDAVKVAGVIPVDEHGGVELASDGGSLTRPSTWRRSSSGRSGPSRVACSRR